MEIFALYIKIIGIDTDRDVEGNEHVFSWDKIHLAFYLFSLQAITNWPRLLKEAFSGN